MNIWAWVEDTRDELRETGNGRLADLIERLPSAVLEDANDEVEAMVPEALALARSLELPWVEIFVRHWHLQATGDGFEKVPYAVETLELSHRDEHRSCPQSVCTVQDLARAYYGADAPGYAPEVLSVVDEALGRIGPSWPCFRCMTSEKMSALVAAGRPEDALEVASEARAELAAIGNNGKPEITTSDALIDLGRYEEALEEARDHGGERDDSFARNARQSRTEALIWLGRLSEALEELLPVDVALSDARYHQSWCWSVERLVRRGRFTNDWRLGAVLEQMVAQQVERGRAWAGVHVAGTHARLAVLRGAPATARRALAAMRELAERLRAPERAAELIADVERRLEALPERDFTLPESADAFIEAWQADQASGPEEDLERLTAAARRWPDDRHVAWARYMALDAIGRADEAIESLRAFADAHRDDRDAQRMYGHTLVDSGETGEAVEAVAGRLDGIDAAWLGARAAYRAGDAEGALRLARQVIEEDAEALSAHQLAALACESLGEFRDALEHRDAVLAGVPEDDNESAHWDRLVPATIVGDWEAVRASAKRLGMELEGESGPVDQRMGLIRLRYDARDFALAVRTGPVSAQVLTVGLNDQPQRAGDTVVFDAAPTNEPEDGQLYTFAVVHVVKEAARRAYAFDGVYPGDDAWGELVRTLEDEGWIFDVHSGEAYEIELDGESVPAVYGGLALPDDVDEQTAHARLAELTAGWKAPFTWLPLAEAAGDEPTVAEQRAHTEALALY